MFGRWLKASQALKKEDQVYGQKLADRWLRSTQARHSTLWMDPLEAAVFLVLVDLIKEIETRREG